jgi:ElaB/YqjD/DUF883 family membrane-anchored ribosome-binding protein
MADMHKDGLNKVNGIAPDFKSKVVKAEDKIEELSHSMGQLIGHKASDLVDTTSGYLKSTRSYVKENPGRAIAMAASAGIVTGALLTFVLRRK